MLIRIASALALTLCVSTAAPHAVFAQGNEASMERMLNALDRPGMWQNVPVSGSRAGMQPGMQNGMQSGMQSGMQPAMRTGMPMQNMAQQRINTPSGFASRPAFQQSGFGMAPAAQAAPRPNLLQQMFGGGAASPPPQPTSPGGLFSRENILKTFFGNGGSGSSSTNSPDNSGKIAQAQENLSTALNQASKAENDCERASYGNDRGVRMGAAESARYAAGSARAAADRASSAAYGLGGLASDYAAQARAAADRAQAAADRATANAESAPGGW